MDFTGIVRTVQNKQLTVWLSVGAFAAVVLGTLLAVIDSSLVGIVLGPLAIAAIAARPRVAVVIAIPIVMLPLPIEVAGIGLQYVVLAALELGVFIGLARRLTLFKPLIAVLLVSSVLLFCSFYFSVRTVVASGAALNNLIALILVLGAVLAVALAAPDTTRTIKMLAWSGAAVSSYNLLFGGLSVSGRLVSESLNANATGHIAGIAIVSAVGLAWTTKRGWWLVLVLPSAYVLIGSQSRAALILIVAGIGVFVIARMGGRGRVALALALIIGLALAWIPFQAVEDLSFNAGRTDDAAEQSTRQRTLILGLAFRLIAENPVTGIGYRAFPDYSIEMLRAGLNTHNDYLRIAVESGLPALISVLLAGVLVIFTMPKSWPYREICLAIVAAAATSFLFANTMSLLSVSLPLWVVLGLFWGAQVKRVCPQVTPVPTAIGKPDRQG